MYIFAKIRAKRKNKHVIESIRNNEWFFFRWETRIIILITFFIALLNILPNWIGDGKVITFTNGERYIPNDLRDNIIFSSFAIGLTIIVAIFVGVFTEIGKYAGKYSSALFVLVPSFVWLLSDRASDNIQDIVDTATLLGNIIFWTTVGILILFGIFTLMNIYFKYTNQKYIVRLRWRFIDNIFNRSAIIFINILILLMLSYGLVNYGLFTLHLGTLTPAMKELPQYSGPNQGPYDFQATNFKTFLAVIAIAFAILMISIGLSDIFTKSKKDEKSEKEFASKMKIEGASEQEMHLGKDENMSSKKQDYIEKLTQTLEIGKNRSKGVLNKVFFFAFIAPFLAIIILFGVSISGIGQPPSWFNWLMFIIFVPLTTYSMVVQQRKNLVGSYGETILILIPTIVWLLGGQIPSIKWLLVISFVLSIIGLISYTIAVFGKFKSKRFENTKHNIIQFLLRIGYLVASVTATMVISVILLHWADFSMHFAGKGNISDRNYSGTGWIMFIIVVSIYAALLLVILGILLNYEGGQRIRNKTYKDVYKTKNSKLSKLVFKNNNRSTLKEKNIQQVDIKSQEFNFEDNKGD